MCYTDEDFTYKQEKPVFPIEMIDADDDEEELDEFLENYARPDRAFSSWDEVNSMFY